MAMEMSKIIKRCEYFCRVEAFREWYMELEILRRRLSPKYADHKEDEKEIIDSRNKGTATIKLYIAESNRGNITYLTQQKMYDFLTEYETILRKFSKKYGYDNPDKDDIRNAMMRK